MIKIAGGAILILCAVLWGRERCTALRKRCEITAALGAFVRYTGERIGSFRDPLDVIFAAYTDKCLEECGFLPVLRESGASAAAKTLSGTLSEKDARTLMSFADRLGAGYEESQLALCTYTASSLEQSAAEQEQAMGEKLKLYRLLPALAAASAVILLI